MQVRCSRCLSKWCTVCGSTSRACDFCTFSTAGCSGWRLCKLRLGRKSRESHQHVVCVFHVYTCAPCLQQLHGAAGLPIRATSPHGINRCCLRWQAFPPLGGTSSLMYYVTARRLPLHHTCRLTCRHGHGSLIAMLLGLAASGRHNAITTQCKCHQHQRHCTTADICL